MKYLNAEYIADSSWDLEELDLDLDKVFDWYVKWDVLRVARTEGSKYEEFPSEMNDTDYKRPYRLNIDGDQIEGPF
tara:strand:- start:272 stop:499 length:228 start_codon:yes stop_codon:yes gene_type:complete